MKTGPSPQRIAHSPVSGPGFHPRGLSIGDECRFDVEWSLLAVDLGSRFVL